MYVGLLMNIIVLVVHIINYHLHGGTYTYFNIPPLNPPHLKKIMRGGFFLISVWYYLISNLYFT